jgi:hypothetical protein
VQAPGDDPPAWHGWPADAPAPAIAPFDADQARQFQQAWANHLALPVEYTNSIGMRFRLVPPGEFLMGGTPEEIEAALAAVGNDEYWKSRIRSESPRHKAILTRPLYLGVHEVTQAQYELLCGKNPSHFAAAGADKAAVAGLDTATHPVELVSWNDAAEFCVKLSEKEQLKPFYFRGGETVTMLEGTAARTHRGAARRARGELPVRDLCLLAALHAGRARIEARCRGRRARFARCRSGPATGRSGAPRRR